MSEIMGKVEQVNRLLQDGEPGNISVDSYMNYCGYRPQSVVDALNQVFGFGSWGFEELSSEIENTDKGQMAVSQVRVWLAAVDFKPTSWGQSNVTRGAVGDARKGAQTDALKKGLSYFSIGNRAYHGMLENPNEEEKSKPRPASKPQPASRPAPNTEPSAPVEPPVSPAMKQMQDTTALRNAIINEAKSRGLIRYKSDVTSFFEKILGGAFTVEDVYALSIEDLQKVSRAMAHLPAEEQAS